MREISFMFLLRNLLASFRLCTAPPSTPAEIFLSLHKNTSACFPPPRTVWTSFSRPKRRKSLALTDDGDAVLSGSETETESDDDESWPCNSSVIFSSEDSDAALEPLACSAIFIELGPEAQFYRVGETRAGVDISGTKTRFRWMKMELREWRRWKEKWVHISGKKHIQSQNQTATHVSGVSWWIRRRPLSVSQAGSMEQRKNQQHKCINEHIKQQRHPVEWYPE